MTHTIATIPTSSNDYLARRLFRNLLHKANRYVIYFARRGRSDRTAALRRALEQVQEPFYHQGGLQDHPSIQVVVRRPETSGGLQAVDYFLWTLQRLYERGEERYLRYLWPAFRLVHDIDDAREGSEGVHYHPKRPLTAAALKGRG